MLRLFVPDAPAPCALRLSRWRSDPLTRGAYSYVPPGASGADIDAISVHPTRTLARTPNLTPTLPLPYPYLTPNLTPNLTSTLTPPPGAKAPLCSADGVPRLLFAGEVCHRAFYSMLALTRTRTLTLALEP